MCKKQSFFNSMLTIKMQILMNLFIFSWIYEKVSVFLQNKNEYEYDIYIRSQSDFQSRDN